MNLNKLAVLLVLTVASLFANKALAFQQPSAPPSCDTCQPVEPPVQDDDFCTTEDIFVSADRLMTPANQGVLSPSVGSVFSAAKVRVINEDKYLDRVTFFSKKNVRPLKDMIANAALYSGTEQITRFVAPESYSGMIVFNQEDIIKPVKFAKGITTTLTLVGNTLGGIDGEQLSFDASITTKGSTSGNESCGFLVDSGDSYGIGLYTLSTRILGFEEDSLSPTGTVGRGRFKEYARWDLAAYGTTEPTDLLWVFLATKLGLPQGVKPEMFRLVDLDNGWLVAKASTIDSFTGEVLFIVPWGNMRIRPGVTKRISLQIDTRDHDIWQPNTAMQWTLASSEAIAAREINPNRAVIVGSYGPRYSVPADAGLVNVGN